MPYGKFWTAFLLLLIIIFSLLIRIPMLNVPLERDEGEYAYIAQCIQQGDLPYRDIVCQKPPGIFYLYLLAFKVTGVKVSQIHFFLCLYVLIEIFLLYRLSLMLFNKPVALISALIFSVITAEPSVSGFAANTEIFMLLPIIVSIIILLAAQRQGKNRWYFICGLLNGAAFIIKQVAALNFVFIVLFIVISQIKTWPTFKEVLKKVLYLSTGFCLLIMIVFLYFLFRSAGPDFIYWVFLHNFDYIAETAINQNLLRTIVERISLILQGDWLFWALNLFACYYLLKSKKYHNFLLPGWFLFSFLGVTVGLRFFSHYFIQIAPALALGSGLGFYLIMKKAGGITKAPLKRLIQSLIVVLLIIIPFRANYKYLFSYSPEDIAIQVYGSNPFVEAKQIGTYLNQNSAKDDTIAIIGSEPEILFYAQRKSATKYIIFYPLTGSYRDSLVKQKQTIQEINRNNPKYIVVVKQSNSLIISNNTEKYFFKKISEKLYKDYYLDGLVLIRSPQSIYLFGQDKKEIFDKCDTEESIVLLYRRR